MRVLLEAHRLARTRDFGGIDSYWQKLVPELLRAADPDTRFTLLTAFLHPRHARAITPYQDAGATLHHWWATPEALHALRHVGASFEWFGGAHDLVHLPEPVCPLRSRGRIVVTAHDLMYLRHPQFLPARWSARLLRGTEQLAHTAAFWICVSEHTREDLVKHYGVARGRTRVIAHGVDASFFAAAQDPAPGGETAQRLGVGGRPYFLFVGSVEPKKNLPVLLEAMGRAASAPTGLRADLAVAGRAGWGAAAAIDEVLARHPALRERVHFLGFVAQEDLAPLVAGARALVLPSRYEGFGMPVLEAMAAGTPVCCADRGALPEVAGGAALLCDPDDVDGLSNLLARLDADDALCETLRVRGRERAAPFTWRRCAEETLAAYRQALTLPRMKLLFDATAMALTGYHKGGAYRYALELLRRLPAAAPEWEIVLYYNFFRRAHLAKMEETCRLAGLPQRALTRVPPQLLQAARVPVEWTAGPHDLFHGPFDVLPRTRRSARVVTIHDLAFLRAPEGLPAAWIADRQRSVPPSARRAHRIVTVSEFSRRDIVTRLEIPENRVVAIHHGIGPEFAPVRDRAADAARLRERYRIEPGFLLYLGTLQPNKNVEGLCAAFQILRREGFGGQLVLAGAPGWLFDEMWSRISARGDDRGVLRTGFVDDEDIPRLYRNCEAFALVSFLEGFGIPVIEAMACGAPVVAADACSLPEVAGDAGLLVDPHDPEAIAAGLRAALRTGPERERRIAHGRAWAARFTWEASARAHVRVYREALEEAAAG